MCHTDAKIGKSDKWIKVKMSYIFFCNRFIQN